MSEIRYVEHKTRSMFFPGTDQVSGMRTVNIRNQLDAPGILPSEVLFYPSGHVNKLLWHRNDLLQSIKRLPSSITLREGTLDIIAARWSLDNLDHREPNSQGVELPSRFLINEETNKLMVLEYRRFGKPFRESGKHCDIEIDSDGRTFNDNWEPIDIDPAEIPDSLDEIFDIEITKTISKIIPIYDPSVLGIS